MVLNIIRIIVISICFTSIAWATADESGVKTIYGYQEYVTILPEGISLDALMDTGALTASLNAINIETYEKDKETWVKFDVVVDAGKTTIHFDKKIKRYANIKLKSEVNDSDEPGEVKRPVVMMDVCLGGQVKEIEVNLTNRSNFSNPMLLGRNALMAFDTLIDSSLTFAQPKTCKA